MTDYDVRAQVALNDCDREPIHIPQAIQGHGLLLVLNPDALTLEQGAGAIEDLTGQTRWIGLPIADLLGEVVGRRLHDMAAIREAGFAGRRPPPPCGWWSRSSRARNRPGWASN